jgi:integrase
MPAKRKKEKISGRYFIWLLGSRDGIFFADGRTNPPHNVGRHSLATRDRQEALEQLRRLDLVKAVEFGLADRSYLTETNEKLLLLEEGKDLYLNHVKRPPVLGGACKTTAKRYRAVFGKFVAFAQKEGVQHWQSVSKRTLEAYGAWLDDQDYAAASEYLELTTIKQAMKWLVEEKHLPTTCVFALPLEKPKGTTTYCYTTEEVAVMAEHCLATPVLAWLGGVIVALASTGLRISELASLRWEDVNWAKNMIRLTDTRNRATKTERDAARSTKGRRDRSLPIANELRPILEKIMRYPDGRIFHGPNGGILKPDTVRNILIREVLEPLAKRFPNAATKKGFRDGRLHSFRHYFCSTSATNGVPEQILMSWLGHEDSKMVRHYYHLHDKPSQEQMARLKFVETKPKEKPETSPPASETRPA